MRKTEVTPEEIVRFRMLLGERIQDLIPEDRIKELLKEHYTWDAVFILLRQLGLTKR